MRTPVRTTLSAALVTLAVTSCGAGGGTGAGGGDGPREADRIRLGIATEEGNLTPHTYATGFPGLPLVMLQYDSLMQVGIDGEPRPWLADSVEAADDGLSYTLDLADGVTWHDGTPLTSADVAFSVDYYKSTKKGRFGNDLAGVESVSTPDPDTVVFTLSGLNPSFELGTLADVPILPKHVWGSVPEPEKAPFDQTTNIGSGPYRLVEIESGQSYRFAANKEYFKGEPTVDEIVVVRFGDDASALSSLQSGELDGIIRSVAPEQIDLLGGQNGLEVIQGPEFTTTLLAFDTQRAPFDDVRVRQAISAAVDRTLLVEDVYLGAAIPGTAGWLHPDSPWADGAETVQRDLDRAKKLLDEAGLTDSDGDGVRELDGAPVELELLAPGNNSLRLRLAELLKTMLGEAGLTVTVSSVESATLDDAVWPEFDVTKGRDYDMALWGWSAPSQADIGQMAELVHSDPAVGTLNVTGFASPAADGVADRLLVERDPAARKQLAGELDDVVAEEVPFVTLLYPNGVYAVRASVYDNWASAKGQGVMQKLSFLPDDARE